MSLFQPDPCMGFSGPRDRIGKGMEGATYPTAVSCRGLGVLGAPSSSALGETVQGCWPCLSPTYMGNVEEGGSVPASL